MEKSCEFCMALSPVVYCESDAAHLCLSCDAKVHSANGLSYRHPRTLVCESCRCQSALVRCFDHEMFMCQNCDTSQHVSLPHQRKVISCYVGCPSAKDLAELWGLDLKELDYHYIESGGGSSSQGTKVVNDDNQQINSHLILQQIVDLERLQLSEGIDSSCLLQVKERTGGLSFRHDTMWKEHKILDNHPVHFDAHLDFQHRGGTLEDKTYEPLSSSFSQLDSLTNTGNPLNGDSFWPYKSPLHNNEIWLQNMQDIGVCDEVQCFDDVNIPDVDFSFRNIEDLFGCDQETSRALVGDKNMDISSSSPMSLSQQSNDVDKEVDISGQVHQSQPNHPRPIRPSHSASLFSVSRITGESSCAEYKDDELSLTFHEERLRHVAFDSEKTKLDGADNAIKRHKDKKVLRHEKQAQYTSPRSKSDFKTRGKGQVLK